MKLGIIISTVLIAIFALTVVNANAKFGKESEEHGPITSPITSPITGPACKPGWGFGDDNHCHFGPPGQVEKENESTDSGHDRNEQGQNHDQQGQED